MKGFKKMIVQLKPEQGSEQTHTRMSHLYIKLGFCPVSMYCDFLF